MPTRWFLLTLSIFLLVFSCQNNSSSDEEIIEEEVSFSERTTSILETLNPRGVKRGQYRIYFQEDTPAAGALDEIEKQLERSKAQSLGLLRQNTFTEPVYLLFVESEEKVAELIGAKEPEFTNPGDRFSIIVYDGEKKSFFTQAIFKHVALHFWGLPGDPILFEGGGTFAQGYCQSIEDPINAIPAQALQEGKICTIRDLVFKFDDCWPARPVTSRMQAASLFQMLFTGFQIDAMERIWQGGLANIEKTIGMSPTDLTKEWRLRMENVTLQNLDLDAVNAQGCR